MSANNFPRALQVSSNGDVVGFLREEPGRLSFEYSAEWLAKADAFPIAPCFPLINTIYVDGDERQWVSSYFDNLLPEEKPRKLLAEEAGVSVTDTWKLLQYCGAETAGALAFQELGGAEAAAGRKQLSLETLSGRIRRRGRISMLVGAPKQISLAGAQAKLAMLDEGDGLFEPVGSMLSTHILKPDSDSEWYPHSAANEHFCMSLAAAVGLCVPETKLYRTPASIFVVERFDRVAVDGEWRARHIVDGAQLLALGGHLKYQMMTPVTLRLCCELCEDPNATSRRLLDWAIFNVLIGNSDAHLKNISFFIDRDGITLAPVYDLISTATYATPDNLPFGPHWPEVKLSMPIGQSERYNQITRNDFLEFGAALGISKAQSEYRLDVLIGRISQHAERIFGEIEMEAGERRLLNAIRQLPIREMSRQLGGNS